jgi:ribosomal protein S18 acetylase RimI-like enzyme
MNIEAFRTEDIAGFLELAVGENWVAEAWEFDFLLRTFPEGCFTARDDSGSAVGFVTALRHEQSGWIGNLIVAEPVRGRGVGEALFARSLDALREAGVDTYWLTASKSGLALYQKYGFTRIDSILRWTGSGRQRHTAHYQNVNMDVSAGALSGIDSLTWGDRRDALLTNTVGRGSLFAGEDGFIAVQPCGDALQFGPFSAMDDRMAEQLFYKALRTIPLGSRIYLDAPVSNRAALRMYNRRRMRISGTTELMYAGKRPDYRPELLYGLATMGSCG